MNFLDLYFDNSEYIKLRNSIKSKKYISNLQMTDKHSK